MGYIRDKGEERTAFQVGSPCEDKIDCRCDVAMVYRLDDGLEERIESYRSRGYKIHFMTGIAWGHYGDFLDGEYDGIDHWDSAQTDRDGNQILHSPNMPYLCPTVPFANYLAQKLRRAVDAGAEAIYVEEPEFFDRGGYCEAFRREYELYYREKWTPPHESIDARYRSTKLKVFLYARTIDIVSASIRDYAMSKYGRRVGFYVPTHSLVNYTQWKIISPEGHLADVPGVDGFISQTWTGTSREKTWYNGELRERTFETAYLEFGAMQELAKGTGRQMWFLHDPIEDSPWFDWDDYKKNYLCVVAASFLHPKVNKYEICPWPHRVYNRAYPENMPNATYIPDSYATILNNIFNLSGCMEGAEVPGLRVGVLCGDAQLYQRGYPDSEFGRRVSKEETGTVLRDSDELVERYKKEIMDGDADAARKDPELYLQFKASNSFPDFFSLAMPFLSYGVPVRPVLLDNVRRYVGYLDDYDLLILSYEFMKPEYPDVNMALAQWVSAGGTLVYVGDGYDPYHRLKSWWTGRYPTPAEHLFELLGCPGAKDGDVLTVGRGRFGLLRRDPAKYCMSKANADELRGFVEKTLGDRSGKALQYRNYLEVKRGDFIITAVMENSVGTEPRVLEGLFADMFTPDFEITEIKTVPPGERSVLFDLSGKAGNEPEIIGTSVRFLSLERKDGMIVGRTEGAGGIRANIRLRLPEKPVSANIDGNECALCWDELSRTALISFDNVPGERVLTIL
ncbi:MAG: hypothetical protein K6C36_09535 [Clostridia bacterium]|nr:hypothetical protein [Clostridia bacterium]